MAGDGQVGGGSRAHPRHAKQRPRAPPAGRAVRVGRPQETASGRRTREPRTVVLRTPHRPPFRTALGPLPAALGPTLAATGQRHTFATGSAPGNAVRAVGGGAIGLYGGTRNLSGCDVERQIKALQAARRRTRRSPRSPA
ncbi:DUF6777 domain-containing protein [Streptomyces sp. NPDC051172]|uniref:DUF6777 domain-containing protein n=1 Tax=Streptomyces sp. NPDC051172 TaxID=3155796 RepID=UPI00343CF61F